MFAEIEAEAQRLGFSLVGIAPATEADTFPTFERWLDEGYAGDMAYLHQHRDARRHPASILAPVRSVIMLSLEYGGAPGNVARYAQGTDYHEVIWKLLNQLGAWLKQRIPECQTRGVVDTAPLLERDFARRAGLGWFGKNTMLINKSRGSFFFLSALLTSVELEPTPPHTASHCGTCTACLEACPTQAFPEPGVLDASRCLSYLTIEHRGPIPLPMREHFTEWLFGCDVCQEVCPWNRHGGQDSLARASQPELADLNLYELFELSELEFRQRFRGTALWRAKRAGLLRNAALILGNTAGAEAIPVLESASHSEDPVLREAAEWALARLHLRASPEPLN